MAHPENLLKALKKENLIALVLNLQNDWEKLMEKFSERLDTLSNHGVIIHTVDNLSSKPDQVEPSLAVTKPVNDNLLNRITSLERSLHAQEQCSRREYIEIVGIPTSNDKNLQSTVCNILNEIDVPCGPEHLEDCHRIKGDHTIVKFSRRKSSEVLRKNKKIRIIDSSKFDVNNGFTLYINEGVCPYYRRFWGKCKRLWLSKVIFPFLHN